jgi:hypothetical protein
MNCDNDFYIRYDRTYVKVKPFCESSDVQMVTEEGGSIYWREYSKGETSLARDLGKLIEEQQKEPLI